MTPYTPSRSVMGRDELLAHRVAGGSRDYSVSDDGYGDMAHAQAQGWATCSAWGRDGWDLGEWPIVSVHMRTRDGRSEVMTIVEGDRDVYAFDSKADQHAAVDYLFLWYAASRDWSPMRGDEGRAMLDAGGASVDPKFRGPFSWARLDAEGGGGGAVPQA